MPRGSIELSGTEQLFPPPRLVGDGRSVLVHRYAKGDVAKAFGWSLYDIKAPADARIIAEGNGLVESAPDGSFLIENTDTGVAIRDAKTGERIGGVNRPNGMAIVWPSQRSIGGGYRFWPVTQAGDRLAVVTWPIPETVTRPKFAPGYEKFNRDPLPLTLRMYDTATGKELWHLQYLTMPANSVQVIPGDTISDFRGFPPRVLFSPDGRRMYLSFQVEDV